MAAFPYSDLERRPGPKTSFAPRVNPATCLCAGLLACCLLAAHAFGSWAQSAQNSGYETTCLEISAMFEYTYTAILRSCMETYQEADHSTNMIHRLLTMRESAKVSLPHQDRHRGLVRTS